MFQTAVVKNRVRRRFAGHQHGLDGKTGHENIFQNVWTEGTIVSFTKLSYRKRLLTPSSFIPSRSLIRVSLNMLIIMLFLTGELLRQRSKFKICRGKNVSVLNSAICPNILKLIIMIPGNIVYYYCSVSIHTVFKHD